MFSQSFYNSVVDTSERDEVNKNVHLIVYQHYSSSISIVGRCRLLAERPIIKGVTELKTFLDFILKLRKVVPKSQFYLRLDHRHQAASMLPDL